jgi:hypothetical protein
MKTLTSLILCASLAPALMGCVTADRDNEHARTSHRDSHDYCRGDGYSFSYDPYNHDMLAPSMGLDPQFPPAYLPCQN